MKIKLVLTVVHVTQEAHTKFLPMLGVTTTVCESGYNMATHVLMLYCLMSCGWTAVRWSGGSLLHTSQHAVAWASRHSMRPPLKTLN